MLEHFLEHKGAAGASFGMQFAHGHPLVVDIQQDSSGIKPHHSHRAIDCSGVQAFGIASIPEDLHGFLQHSQNVSEAGIGGCVLNLQRAGEFVREVQHPAGGHADVTEAFQPGIFL